MPTYSARDRKIAAAHRLLYERLPDTERATIDAECVRLRAKMHGHGMGPELAFEVVMATHRWAMAICDDSLLGPETRAAIDKLGRR